MKQFTREWYEYQYLKCKTVRQVIAANSNHVSYLSKFDGYTIGAAINEASAILHSMPGHFKEWVKGEMAAEYNSASGKKSAKVLECKKSWQYLSEKEELRSEFNTIFGKEFTDAALNPGDYTQYYGYYCYNNKGNPLGWLYVVNEQLAWTTDSTAPIIFKRWKRRLTAQKHFEFYNSKFKLQSQGGFLEIQKFT